MSQREHPFADLLEMKFLSRDDKSSLCTLLVTESTLNPNHTVHGGVFFTLVDTGMGGAIFETLNDGELCAAIEIKLSFFNAVWDGELLCKSKIIKRGKRITSAEAEIFNHDKLVAKASGSFSIFTPSKTKKD